MKTLRSALRLYFPVSLLCHLLYKTGYRIAACNPGKVIHKHFSVLFFHEHIDCCQFYHHSHYRYQLNYQIYSYYSALPLCRYILRFLFADWESCQTSSLEPVHFFIPIQIRQCDLQILPLDVTCLKIRSDIDSHQCLLLLGNHVETADTVIGLCRQCSTA